MSSRCCKSLQDSILQRHQHRPKYWAWIHLYWSQHWNLQRH